jgi:hypothetical protein
MPWFKRPSDGELYSVLDHYPDTIARLRSEGWAEVETPVATTEQENVAAQAQVVTPAPASERAAPTADTPKRPAVKPKTTRRRTPARKPSSAGRKVGQA